MNYTTREEVSAMTDGYDEIFKKESHHDHKIIEDDNGTLRWESNDSIKYLFDKRLIDLNEIAVHFSDKNSEVYRKLNRDLGYSLSGYWELFYWEINNPIVDQYRSDLQ